MAKKIFFSLMSTVLVLGIVFTCCFFFVPQFNSWVKGAVGNGDNNGNNNMVITEDNIDMTFNDVKDHGVKMLMAKLPRSAYKANGISETALISYTVNATIYPSNVENKKLSWKLTCDSDIDISTYLTISVSDDTSSCVLTCHQAFPDYTIKLIATSLDSGAYGSVNIRCEGIPKDMNVVDSDGNTALSVKWNNPKDFNINLTNDINFVGDTYRQNIKVKSVNVYGTVRTYTKYFVDAFTSTLTLDLNCVYAEGSGVSHDINNFYEDLVSVSVKDQILTITPSAYPKGSSTSTETGVLHMGKRGTMFNGAVLPPEDVYVEIVLACGDIEKTIRVDFVTGVQSVNLGSDIVW